MPSWFKKVFNSGSAAPVSTVVEGSQATAVDDTAGEAPLGPPDPSPDEDSRDAPRKVINAPHIMPDEERSGWSEDVTIKAQVQRDMMSCVLMVDRPVLDKLSVWFPQSHDAGSVSTLAGDIFKVAGVGSVLIHDFTVTITLEQGNTRPWEDLAAEVGAVMRRHLKAGDSIVSEAFLADLPPEDEIRRRLQSCIDLEINPGIASHSGVITLERVVGNTVYLTMGGGCQGCAASAVTLRQGIHSTFRKAVPQIGAIFDETDHSAGTNPFYDEIPAGMVGE